MVQSPERPHRDELCLNGLWQFQPVALPPGYKRNQGTPPELAQPRPDGWSSTPIKIPSHWNINTWGGGRRETRSADRLYWPDSVYFPSYPVEWDRIEMGWLRRSFRAPESWRSRRIILHFEAVAGECQILLNGRRVAEHFDSFLPFAVDVTEQIRWDADNELLMGVRGPNLFNKTSSRYPKFLSPYPPGSMTDTLVGIWQDVFLLARPPVRVADTFVKTLVGQGVLEAEVELANDSREDQTVQLAGNVCPWINQAGKDQLSAPEPKWRLESPVLSLAASEVTIKAGQKTTVVLRQPVAGQLRFWSPQSPNLYGLVLTVSAQGMAVDGHYTRFGWRELAIQGPDLLLNGEKIKVVGDFVHPFGAYVMSRRHVWAWYQMIKDVGGNAVRPHAQVHPRIYAELADEMGLLLLAETSVFGSSIKLNPDEPVFWERYAAHYDGLIRRDRNHPSVMGWSFGNEMFAIPRLNKMSAEDTAAYYQKLIAIGRRSPALDPTRTWITCDGDEDLNGSLPVWSKHFGHGDVVDKLPKNLHKPLKVGESGGTYYATPEQLSVFNGDRAYASYLGRNEALAIDLYDNVVKLALPHLSYFSPSLVAWYGLEHLNLGYRDFTRLPNLDDGVRFTRPFAEGKPGMQPERLPPYVTTLNPGWDASLPLYQPLPMFHAMKAALAPGGPKPCPWDHRINPVSRKSAPVPATVEQVAFAGADDAILRQRLLAWGVPVVGGELQAGPGSWLVIDGQSLNESQAQALRLRASQTMAAGGTVLLMVRDSTASASALNALLAEALTLTDRPATMLQPRSEEGWVTGLGLGAMYFAKMDGDRRILKCGLAGKLVERGHVVLEAGATDWSLFNNVPEKAKAAAVVLYEHLQKPSGAALVRVPQGKGTLALCSIDYRLDSPACTAMWRTLFGNMGVKLAALQVPSDKGSGKAKEHDLLLNGPMEHSFTYLNPITSPDIPAIRDPQIIPFAGAYYLIGSSPPFWGKKNGDGASPGVKMWRSTDLLHWSFHRMLIDRNDVPAGAWYRDKFWAPEIHQKNGRFYLTFNCQDESGTTPYNALNVGIAVADRIDGPYEILTREKPVWAKANDGSLFTDDDGRTYLFVSDIWGCEIDLTKVELVGEKRQLIKREPGRWDAGIIEGPMVFKRNGLYYLIYSSNTRGYEIGYATAPHPLGPYTKGKRSPFFGAQNKRSYDSVIPRPYAAFADPRSPYIGAGHNTIFKGPDGRDWICAHYEVTYDEKNPEHRYKDFFPNGKPEARNQGRYRTELLGIDPFWFDANGDLVSGGPSYTKQTVTW